MALETLIGGEALYPNAVDKINNNFQKVENKTGEIGSRPSAGTEGRIWLPNSGPFIFRDNGVSWDSFGPIFKCTPTSSAGWSWANQGSSTVTDNPSGTMTMAHPGASGTTHNWSHLVKTLPVGNYTWTVFLQFHMINTACSGGITLRNDSTGAFVTFGVGVTSTPSNVLFFDKMTNNTTFSASYFSVAGSTAGYALRWLKIQDNGTNRIVSISYDGEAWIQLYSVSRTDFTTPTQYGFSLRGTGNSTAHALTILSESMVAA